MITGKAAPTHMPKQQLFFTIDSLVVVHLLGEGYSAKVYLAHDQHAHYYALKVFRSNQANRELALHEIEILQQLSHPHVVGLVGYNLEAIQLRTKQRGSRVKPSSKHKVVIIFEYLPNGELFDLIKTEGSLGEYRSRCYFRQLLQTLHYLSTCNVAHKDLKPENILLDHNMNIKLIDFGFADQTQDTLSQRFQGTKSYMSPELLEKKQYGRMTNDLFSLGVILFIMVLGWPPFGQASPQDPHYRLLINKNYQRFWQMHHRQAQLKGPMSQPFLCSVAFMDLVQHMLEYSPEDRLSFEQVMQHPWLNWQPTYFLGTL